MGDDGHRWTDKFWNLALIVIGALSAILWGIIWGSVSNLQARTAALEASQQVTSVKLDVIVSDVREIKQELKSKGGTK